MATAGALHTLTCIIGGLWDTGFYPFPAPLTLSL